MVKIHIDVSLKLKTGAVMVCFCMCSWVGGVGSPSVHSY